MTRNDFSMLVGAGCRAVTTLVVAAVLGGGGAVYAQSLQQQNEEILNELRQIRQLLEKLAGPMDRPAAAGQADDHVTLGPVTGYMLGRPDAPLTMVEFTDLQCPFCRQFHLTTFEQVKKEYIDTGKLRYVSRDFPLVALHPLAQAAAKAAHCAADQGKFWEMRHSILVINPQLVPTSFDTLAQDLHLNVTAFKACEADPSKFQVELKKDESEGAAAGVTGTPSFIIGSTSATGLVGVRVVGAQPYSVFDEKLKTLLAEVAVRQQR